MPSCKSASFSNAIHEIPANELLGLHSLPVSPHLVVCIKACMTLPSISMPRTAGNMSSLAVRIASWASCTAWPVFRVCWQPVLIRHGFTVLCFATPCVPCKGTGWAAPAFTVFQLLRAGCWSRELQHHLVIYGCSCSFCGAASCHVPVALKYGKSLWPPFSQDTLNHRIIKVGKDH